MKIFLFRLFGTSIKNQFGLLLFGLTAAAMIAIGFLGIRGVLDSGDKSEQITASSTKESAEQFLKQTATSTAEKNSIIFKKVQHETSSVAEYQKNVFDDSAGLSTANWNFDSHIKKVSATQYANSADELGSVLLYLTNGYKLTPENKHIFELTGYLDYVAPQVLTSNPDIAAVYFVGPETGETRYYPNIELWKVSPLEGFNPSELEFATIAHPANNPEKTTKWSSVYDDPAGNGLVITAAHPIYSKANKFMGTISADVLLTNISKNIEDYVPIEGSYTFLVNNLGRAVALPAQGYKDILDREAKKNEFGADLTGVKTEFSNVLQQMRGGKEGFATIQKGSERLNISFTPVEGTPFSLGIVAREDKLLGIVKEVRTQVVNSTNNILFYQILPIGLAIFGTIFVIGFFYIRRITKPLVEITEKTRKVMLGDFSQHIDVESENEIGKLAAAFNTMTKELATSYKALERKVQERTESLNQKVRELADAKAKDDAILTSIGEGMIVTDSSGYIMLINEIAAEMLNVDHAAMVGKKVSEYDLYDTSGNLLPPEERPLPVAMATHRKTNQAVQVITQKGTKRTLSVTSTPVIENEQIIGGIQIIRDITKEKEIDRMKTEFISIASHQLRTPLSAIRWFGEMLLNGDAGKLQQEQEEFVKNMADSTQRMIDLVNSLLNISRIESGRIMVEPQPTDLNELVSGITNDLKAKTEERQQTLLISVHKDLPKINLDPRLIGQVYLNLLTNAIKYTPKGGEISVFISRKGDDIISQVTDNGFGIPKAEQGKMFQKFFRATNIAKMETDGTGLGMYLVKSIIESSGGKIWFESEEGKGTTFWFSLPATGMKRKEGEVTLD